MIKVKKLEEIVRSLDEVLQPFYLEIEAGIAEDIHVAIAEEILKHHKPISEKGDALKELYEDGYLDGFEKGKGVVMGTTDCIPISEVKILIAREITIANSEGQPTSRLTSLYNKLTIGKSKEENK